MVVEGNSPPPCNDDVVDSIENPLLVPPAIYVVREDILLAIRRRDVANIMDSSSRSRIIVATNRGGKSDILFLQRRLDFR